MRAVAVLFVTLAGGCDRFVDDEQALWPPPEAEDRIERHDPGGFDPCPSLEISEPIVLSASATAIANPRIAWSQETEEFLVVWREENVIEARRVGLDGQPVGLGGALPVEVDGDPAVLWMPGLHAPGFFVTVQSGGQIGLDRLLANGRLEPGPVLDGAFGQAPPTLAHDGHRIAIAYDLPSPATRLVSLALDGPDDDPVCLHPGADAEDCADSALVEIGGPHAVGWLPPADEAGAAAVEATWWMAVLHQQRLEWLALAAASETTALESHANEIPIGTDDVAAAARIASGGRQMAVALRQGPAGATELWQRTAEGTVACVLREPLLSEGRPAPAWGHGRRVAVLGIWPRADGAVRDVVLARGDAPPPGDSSDDTLGSETCPAPLDVYEVTRGLDTQARDPDLAFAQTGYGLVWAQATPPRPSQVYFAVARCRP